MADDDHDERAFVAARAPTDAAREGRRRTRAPSSSEPSRETAVVAPVATPRTRADDCGGGARDASTSLSTPSRQRPHTPARAFARMRRGRDASRVRSRPRSSIATLVVALTGVVASSFATRAFGARFKVEIATLRVQSPTSVSGRYDVAIANFGRTLYGATLTGVLTYPRETSQRTGCGDDAVITLPDDAEATRMAIILLLDRGGCPFTEKVMNGQRAGADAVIIVDNTDEPLLTMDAAADAGSDVDSKITVPAALITKADGNKFENAIANTERVVGTMDWHDILPHPDSRVEWELWSETNDECGRACQAQNAFLRDFKAIAQSLERGGYTQFTPHYLTWECMDVPPTSKECQAQCVNVGRYCAPDPEEDINSGYSGADVVIDNLRALCVFDVVNKTGSPWLWWDYVADFSLQCTMQNGNFALRSCAESIMKTIGVDAVAVDACVGDTSADRTNPMLEAQIALQSPPESSSRPDIRLLPTVLINEERYSGKLARGEVLTALCAGFEEHTIPSMCSDAGLMHAMCVRGQEGDTTCSADAQGDGRTACRETSAFPFFECVCPEGSQSLVGPDDKMKCESVNKCAQAMHDMANCSCERCVCTNLDEGRFQCKTQNKTMCESPLARGATSQGGCWANDGFTACVDNIEAKKKASREGRDPDTVPDVVCRCPKGFEGDGKSCHEIDECATKCKGSHAKCSNTYGSYTCTCADGYVANYQPAPVDDYVCLSQHRGGGASLVITSALMSVLAVASASYAFYQYRARSYMDKEIRQIMAQYMPLENQMDDDDDDDSPYDQPPSRPARVVKQSFLPVTNTEMSDF